MLSSSSSSGPTSAGAGSLHGMSGSGSGAQQQSATSYSNERPGAIGAIDVEYASDPASGGFFHADYKKHDDLKQMLDSNKDSLKLEAMKRIIAMVAKGRDAGDLFPAVVKNVVSKNIEVKKLVYVYLVRYAEEQQDLALLSISTFQRALKDPNQLIRAGALRVLSSIRVSMIVPIVMLAIRDSASDMSPYVRKTAAHAIPKLYGLDGEQKEELIGVIERLLSDRTTLVVGSAVMAFEEVCPERVDLIHKNYRKLCNLLVDVDEWGQIIIINMLTRYARTQFVDPNRDDYAADETTDGGAEGRPFYDETTSEEEEEEEDEDEEANDDDDDDDDVDEQVNNARRPNGDTAPRTPAKSAAGSTGRSPKKVVYQLDADHRLLLRQTKPLLQSRNASVVMTVAQLYHHVAPRAEVALVAKALIRLLRSHKEVQSVVLTSIASMSTQRKSIFEPYLRSFFVRTSDATHIKLLKLEILTNLATPASISMILREFQTYISSVDKAFVAATIQAIGRCAASIRAVTETCLSGLVQLLSNRDEYVVAEAVVVIKQLLQTQAADHFDIISQMAKLLDFIAVAAARAAILWLIGEYNEKVPRLAPDVLRKLAKTFVDEENIVKLQVLNLAVKLYLCNAAQTELLCQYVFSLARYDPHYDVRDRARFLKPFVFPAAGRPTVLSRRARDIFLAAKPAPQLLSKYEGREQFQLGSLSHYLNARATGYHDIPDFPEVASDSAVRHVESPTVPLAVERTNANARRDGSVEATAATAVSPATKTGKSGKQQQQQSVKKHSFYSESEKSSSSYGPSSSSAESSDDEELMAKAAVDTAQPMANTSAANEGANNSNDSGTSDSEEDSSSSSGSSSSSSASSDDDDDDDSSSSAAASSSGSDADTSTGAQTTSKTFAKAQSLATQFAANTTNGSAAKPNKSNLDLLLELDDIAPAGPIMTPSLGGFLTPSLGGSSSAPTLGQTQRIEPIGPSYIPLNSSELLSASGGNGLAIGCRYTRAPHLYSAAMVSIELVITNTLDRPLSDVRMDCSSSSSGASATTVIKEFAPIAQLAAGGTIAALIGIEFNDSTQPVQFAVTAAAFGAARVHLRPAVGDLVRSVRMSAGVFAEERAKLRGMNEHSTQVRLPELPDRRALVQRVLEYANVALVATDPAEAAAAAESLCFAGQTFASGSLVLVVVELPATGDGKVTLSVSCEKMVIGSMALSELRAWLLGGSA